MGIRLSTGQNLHPGREENGQQREGQGLGGAAVRLTQKKQAGMASSNHDSSNLCLALFSKTVFLEEELSPSLVPAGKT